MQFAVRDFFSISHLEAFALRGMLTVFDFSFILQCFVKSFSRLTLFCNTIPFLCQIILTGFPTSSNTIHLVDISSHERRDAFVLVTGNTVTTCAGGAVSAAAAVSAADEVVHGNEDVEQGERNKKVNPSIVGRRGRT